MICSLQLSSMYERSHGRRDYYLRSGNLQSFSNTELAINKLLKGSLVASNAIYN